MLPFILYILPLSITSVFALPAEPDVNIVDLGYSSYRGTSLDNGVSRWLGIRYAAPPVGNLRFRAPRDPLKTTTLQEANAVIIILCPVNVRETDRRVYSLAMYASRRLRRPILRATQKTASFSTCTPLQTPKVESPCPYSFLFKVVVLIRIPVPISVALALF